MPPPPSTPGTPATTRSSASHAGALDALRHRVPSWLERLVRAVRDRDIMFHAGGLAFYALISVVPFVVIGFWIAGAVVGTDRLVELGENIDRLAPTGADASAVVETFADVGTGIGIGALVSALWPATAYGSGLVRAFDAMADRPDRPLQGPRGRAKALLFLVLLPMFLLGALGISYVATATAGDGAAGTAVGWALALGGGFAAGTVTLSLIYHLFGPDRLPVGALVRGAAAGAAAVATMSLGYVVYLGQGADFEERVAGSGLASVVLLALWLYLANALLLAGFCVSRWLAHRSGWRPDGG